MNDIVLLVEEFLKDHQDERDIDNDSYAHNGKEITRWNFTNIHCPSPEVLAAYADKAAARVSKMEQKIQARKILKDKIKNRTEDEWKSVNTISELKAILREVVDLFKDD